jgi:hypothetical protein
MMYHHAANVLISTSICSDTLYVVLSPFVVAVDRFHKHKDACAPKTTHVHYVRCTSFQLYVVSRARRALSSVYCDRSASVLPMIAIQHQFDLYDVHDVRVASIGVVSPC